MYCAFMFLNLKHKNEEYTLKNLLILVVLLITLMPKMSFADQDYPAKHVYSKLYVVVYDRGEYLDPVIRKGIWFFAGLTDVYGWSPAGEYAGGESRFSNMNELNALRAKNFGYYFCENGNYEDIGESYIGVINKGNCRNLTADEQNIFVNRNKSY